MRYTATVKEIRETEKPAAGKLKTDCRPGRGGYLNEIELCDVCEFETGRMACESLVVLEKTVLSRDSVRIFPGNEIAFDATVRADKIKNLRNICGMTALDEDQFEGGNATAPRILKNDAIVYAPDSSGNLECPNCHYRADPEKCRALRMSFDVDLERLATEKAQREGR